MAVGPIANNQILTAEQWTELTVDITPLAEQIPSGKQAMTISLDNIKGVNGFVEPGDRVNMIITLDMGVFGEDRLRRHLCRPPEERSLHQIHPFLRWSLLLHGRIKGLGQCIRAVVGSSMLEISFRASTRRESI